LKTSITHREVFNSAHIVKADPFCGERLHGHDWFAEVTVEGTPDPKTGSIDTAAPSYLWATCQELHGKNANEMMPGIYVTPEGLANFIFERLRLEVPGLRSVTVGFAGHHATAEV
jgi:6-pyruvoyltetrahydropterin/6-carboxytetrahydropterin synthase